MKITPEHFCIKDKDKCIIDKVMLERYVTQQGFRCMYEDTSQKDIRVVRIVDKRVKKSSTNFMYRYVVSVLENGYENWLQPLKNYTSFLFAATIIQMVRIEPNLLKDTVSESFIPFDNGIVSVTKRGVKLKTYEQVLTGETCIMNDRIIPRSIDLSITNYKNGDWYKFCLNAVGEEGLPYLMRTIGYLLHTYKDKSNAKMIMYSDTANTNSTNAMGGSGKSIIAYDCLKEIRYVHWEDGKEFDPKGKFKFQGITAEHDIICIDDIPKGFRQEVIYNKVTGNFSSEEKFKSRQTFSFDNSFKTVITGNHGLVISGGSDARRTCMIGFTDYYNMNNQPIHEFGVRFFKEWYGDAEIQFQYFYAFCFECIRMYLQQGIESYKFDEIVKKGIYNSIPENKMLQFDKQMKLFIGEDNCMRMSDWQLISGIKEDIVIDIMKNKGYEVKVTRKKTPQNPSRSQRYYFEEE